MVIPSRSEGIPNTLFEAWMAKKPVIATKVGGNLDVINKKNGFLIDKNNHDQLYKAMKYLIFNRHRIRQLSAQAIKDSKSIRRSSLENSVPYYTTVSGAIAAVSGIKAIKNGEMDVDTIQSYKK